MIQKPTRDWLPVAILLALLVVAIALYAAYCTRVSAEQQPTPTPAPVATPTWTPVPTITAAVLVPTPIPTLPAPTSTPTPSPTIGRQSEDFNTPVPTATLRPPFQPGGQGGRPVQAPYQAPGRR